MDKELTYKSGGAVQEFDFEYPVLSIGSHPDNDIVLPGGSVLAFHATLHLQNGQFHLIALGGTSSVQVDGLPIKASPVRINQNQRIEIGNYSLFFRENGSPESVHVSLMQSAASSMAAALAAQSIAMPDGESPILVNAPLEQAEVDVEQTAIYELEVINAGPIVAGFFISLSGVPEEWVEISPRMVNLNEGQRTRVRISVTPPRDPSSVAGRHNIQTQVQSPNYGGRTVVTPLTLVVHPYYEFVVGNLSPKDQRIPWRKRTGLTKLAIANHGNSPADFNVSVLDDENGCTFDLLVNEETQLTRQALVNVPAGETFTLPIQIAPHKRRLFAFSSKRYFYTTTVQVPQSTLSQMTSGSVSAVPLFGWWSIVLTVLFIGLALFLLLQPNIYSFQVAAGKDVIELGDSTRLEWSVSPFATNLSVSGVEQTINRGQTSLTLAPTQSTTYEIVAGNWLSGLLRIDQRRSLTVLVVPPSPRVNVFDVGETSVARGKPVTVRWSVTRADQAFLTIDDVVYELPKEEFSGEREVILEDDALVTLEAKNASGSELRSYFVNVVPPKITVRTFTVWVRPQANAGLPANGPSKLFSVLNIPDPNFPQKYVELVTDRNSDSGYRVEFHQPARELSKGEQVMLEWNIEGTDTGKILVAPFTEALPARGSQPFFPQESMNFVMTAKSGELEQLFMLPVKVFDGTPPTAPKIDFFKASPVKAIGATDVQFAWSVSGNWTRIQLATEGNVVADYLNPQGFKSVRVSKSTTYILTAWNGTLSSAAPIEITIDPSLVPVDLEITGVLPDSGRFLVGDKVSVTVAFGTLPVGKPKPTGTIFVSDSVSTCTIVLPALTCELTFKTPGDPKKITASYLGDTIYLQSDSPPFPAYITVTSATANLTPSYFFLTKPGNTQGGNIPVISNQTLLLDSGLFIKVKVVPVSTVLPDDTNGKVTVSICGQQIVSGQPSITPGSCVFIGASTVKVVDGTGTADVVIANFPLSGPRVLLFEYRHDQNALSPATYTQFDINVSKMGIYLSLPSCTDPVNFVSCEIGIADPANTKVIFDIRRSVDNNQVSASLPAPENAAFDVFEVDGSNVKSEAWSCAVILATEMGDSVYKLECKANVTGQTNVAANFDFDNTKSANYYMGANSTVDFVRNPFNISVKTNTVISLNTADLAGIKVGQIVKLTSPTGGAISLANTNGVPITSVIGGLRLSASDNALFGIVPGSSCTLNSGVVQMTTISGNCSIYFTKQGTFSLTVSFLGDPNYYPSVSTVPSVSIAKQDGIKTAWQYKDSTTYTEWDITSWEKNKNLPIRIVLSGPANFAVQALNSKTLEMALNIVKNTVPAGTCSVAPFVSTSGTNPRNYQLAIDSSSGSAVVDFTLNCSSDPMDLTFGIQLSDTANFAFTTGQETEKGLVIAMRPTVGMTIDFIRAADNDPTVVNGPPAILKTLFVGETYRVQIKAGILWADAFNPPFYPGGPLSIQETINRYLNTPVQITLPSAIQSQVDWGQSTCQSTAGAKDLKVVLNSYNVVNSYGYDPSGVGIHDIELYNSAPCILTFKPDTLISGTGTATFVFSVADPTYPWKPDYSVTRTYQTQGLDKQNVSIAISPVLNTVGQVNDPSQNAVLTLTRQISTSTLPPLDTTKTFLEQFSYSAPIACTGLNLTGTITSATTATLVYTPPSVQCSGSFSIQYNGVTNWFKVPSPVTSALDYTDLPSTTTTLTSSLATTKFGQSVTFTATVAVVPPGTGTPTGTIQFKNNGVNLGSPVSLSSLTATYTTPALSAGSHSLTAVFTPSNSFKPSTSSTFLQTVEAADTTTSLIPSKSPSVLGETITFTATVSAQPPGGGIPNGTVQFKDGAVNLGLAVTLDAAGKAALTTNTLGVGAHTITAVYTPANSNYNTSPPGEWVHNVNLATGTNLLSNQSSTRFGESVTFTATVFLLSPGTGIPTGSVQFKDGAVDLGAPVALNASGVASLTVNSLGVGNHTISAVYVPDPGLVTSISANVAHTVNKSDTTTTFSFNPATPAGPFTFTATVVAVAPGIGTPTGTVNLCVMTGQTCSTVLATLTLTGGTGTSATITLAAGNYNNLSAVYVGDDNFNGSTSANKENITIP
jgi:hypothetical protein